jgi:hypothetical protein
MLKQPTRAEMYFAHRMLDLDCRLAYNAARDKIDAIDAAVQAKPRGREKEE